MTFDAGTWWLAVLLLGFVTAGLVYLLKRSLFGRIDEQERSLKEVRDTTVKKKDYEKDLEKVSGELEDIRRDYTPRSVHDKCYDEVRMDVKTIMASYLTKEDFFREFSELDRKINLLLEYKIKGEQDL